jgi:hypothetical protein
MPKISETVLNDAWMIEVKYLAFHALLFPSVAGNKLARHCTLMF